MLILREKQVLELVPFSRMTLYRLEKQGGFPKRIKLAPHRVGWLETEIREWIEERAAQRNGA